MTLHVETELEDDGRWIGAVPELPGVLVYADTREGAVNAAVTLALRVLADRAEHGEAVTLPFTLALVA
ncbi:MAG: HicB family protein [Deltaproteobacteria bacterium HGW-Deltaproteobacteria-14]|jgi:predicted RNase H-like HicB family nuclease|nr:MAG: HicB family protein [Deltaproteobacteria bacterium HGW-Deltaproteobacteria-14]